MVRIYTRHWPYVIAIVSGDLEERDFDYMYEQYQAIHDRDERFYLAQETRKVKLPNAVTRKRLGELNAHFAADIEKRVVQVGVIVASRVFAAAVRAIWWVSREATTTTYLASAVECWDNADQLCSAEGLKLPASGRTFMEQLDAEHKAGRDFTGLIER